MDMIELYKPEPPDAMLKTQYGYQRYEDWITKEADRIGGQPGRKTEIIRKPNSIALYVNRVANGKVKI